MTNERTEIKKREASQKKLQPKKSQKLGIDYVEVGGRKVPYCCMKFKGTGKCEYEANTGKKCGFKHLTQKEFDEYVTKLAAE